MTRRFPENNDGMSMQFVLTDPFSDITKKPKDKINKLLENNEARRNVGLVEINNVLRPTEVMAVWDLHWNINALYWNLSALWVISKNSNWIWWNTQLVFLWDIIGDRHASWFEILTKINELNKQAEASWWAINIVAWNHDNMVISFLLWRDLPGWRTYVDYWIKAKWIEELIEFVNEDEKEMQLKQLNNIYSRTNSSYNPPNKLDRTKILTNMKNSEKWRELLEIICNMKVVEQIDDILFVHTDIMPGMIELILKYWVDKINQIFQDWLKKVLLKWYNPQKLEEFWEILDIFLDTDNRYLFLSDSYLSWGLFANVAIEQIKEKLKNGLEALKQKWINIILHWHSYYWNFSITEGWIIIRSLDRFAYKKTDNDEVKSIGIVHKNWNIEYWEEKKSLNWF
ncbi:MAG: hypothetical protein ACD_49C00013G0012 [uncultured bacterium (gcode 4)]|uniref:Uncharacterized protein n=1 Tax=uncultured bacterium (gcode 4) TaxID=1234023 RepID=K2AFJ5_9BACT|nr:MAG: hypothetical protein ACD_49C00013G0012 [uncultured bacterium (gcode 4)]